MSCSVIVVSPFEVRERHSVAVPFVKLSPLVRVIQTVNDNLQQQAFSVFDNLIANAENNDYTVSDYAFLNPKRTLAKNQVARSIDMSQLSTSGAFPSGWEMKPFNGGMRFTNGDTLLADQAIEAAEAAVAHLDQVYAAGHGVPRYFNSYAERVVYNRLFATLDERTVLIPDNLFYAHMELADVLSQIKGAEAAIPHLNRMVAYAPAYPLSHLKLAIQLARNEDWDSARAACLNALRVALDRDDAAFAYYRFAYAEWMLDRFDTAAAAYIMSDHIAPGAIGSLESELQELVSRADSQCVPVPESVEAAAHVLATHDLPVWPHIEVADIVRDAARVCVDEDMFVPARTLSVAVARMNDGEGDNIDIIQAQFLRSLSA